MLKVATLFALVAVLFKFGLDFLIRKEYSVPADGGIILVSGSSSGIGKHACLEFGKLKRFEVYCTVRKEKDAAMLERESKGGVKTLLLDVTKKESILSVVDSIKATGLPFVGLVNNAGVGAHEAVETDKSLSTIRWVFDVNFFGVLELTQPLIPLLRESKGRILTVGSVAGIFPSPAGGTAYSGSKYAIEAMSDALRNELNPFGVSVSLLEPAFVVSDIIINAKQAAFERIKEGKSTKRDMKKELYPQVYGDAAMSMSEQGIAQGSPQSVTSDAIIHAMTDAYPKDRYIVANVFGVPAWVLQRVFQFVPYRLSDFLMSNI